MLLPVCITDDILLVIEPSNTHMAVMESSRVEGLPISTNLTNRDCE